ncbi:hypothetical protein DLAC_08629 [Tieghemostelium lacteum]|uniref:GH84 domain-containing protein n=1 Tax=Tieghemostelium lacteum TaxID=361077 RepID=A0A151Z7Y3_TIELA|nr:hypothetical protein DLAC_08629 [Tieghemostelium lacteum]|eukprot:KYQ90045.1 hypothetical protein DLAC_08629 [Tieghemostelium lacteum]
MTSQQNPPLTYETLKIWAVNKLDKLLGMASNEIVDYILDMDSTSDVEQYLLNDLLDTTAKSKSFTSDLIKKINSLPRKVTTNKFQKVVTPPTSGRINIKSNQTNNIKPKNNSNAVGSAKKDQKQQKQKISSFSDIQVQMRPGEPCDCQATKHKLITNCLNCGKIVCEQEGKGPCQFCQVPLFTNPNTMSLQQQQQYDKSLMSATQYKDRILGYQSTSAKRTIVYDDQEDYFSNKNNKWLSEEERKVVSEQEKEYLQKLEEEKKKTKIAFDFVGRRITAVPFDPSAVKVSKIEFQSNNNAKNSKDISNTYSESIKENKMDTAEFKYHHNIRKAGSMNTMDNAGNNKVQDFNSIVTKQYYGVDEDLIVLKSKESMNGGAKQLKYRGIMEGLWGTFTKRLPNKIWYFKYLEMLSEHQCNYFIVSIQNYCEWDMSGPVPKEVLMFLKLYNIEASKLGITLNLSLTLPQSFVFGDEQSVTLVRNVLANVKKECDISEFTLILPSGFNSTFTLPICAPNSTKSEVNNAKTYSTTQTLFIQKLLDKNKDIKTMMVVPSFFEMNLLQGPPTRQQIEYWLEISKSVPSQCPIVFTTVDGSLQNQTMQKVKSIFERRELVLIEKYPYKGGVGHKEHKVSWNPYEPHFTDTHHQLAGVLASPFDRESLLDNMTSVIATNTFLHFLQVPTNYQSELSLRATLLELTSNNDISEIFSDLILTTSNGLIENIKLYLENNKKTALEQPQQTKDRKKLDNREKLILGEVRDRSTKLLEYYKPIQPNDSIIQQFEFIIDTIAQYLSI